MKIKICGLYREEDAHYVNCSMPDFAGFVFYPKSHRYVADELAVRLRSLIKPEIKTVGVFVDEPMGHILSLLRGGAIDIAQLHGHEDEAYIAALRTEAPGVDIWKAFKVRSAADLAFARESTADRVLLDNGYGTGESFDWSLIRGLSRPFLLAGGLTPENIPEAATRLRPWGVDISSGVETERRKDPAKIMTAVMAAHGDQ